MRANFASWREIDQAAQNAITSHADTFGDDLRLCELAPYPRPSNTFLCNNTTYTVGYVMDHPGDTTLLMDPSHPRDGFSMGLAVSLAEDRSHIPRLFIHWPKPLSRDQDAAAADVLRAVIGAQLRHGQPYPGDNDIAELD